MKILLIDDDAMWAQGLVNYLTLIEGWEVVLRLSPTDGVAALQENRNDINLILLDIMMSPDQEIDEEASNMGQDTGLLLLNSIVELTGGEVPVVLLTTRQDVERSQYEGKACLYLQKSQTASEIANVIRGICDEWTS